MMNNMSGLNMMNASDRIMNAISFGNSQPLKPTLHALNADELVIKANETKAAVGTKLMDSLRKRLAKEIAKSTPQYSGLNYKA